MFLDTHDLRSDEIFLTLDRTTAAYPEKGWVLVYHFLICRLSDGVQVGHCDLRIGHTERLFFGGNIGYGIEPPFRGHHYAGKACLLLFRLAAKHDMRYLYITCNPQNTASRKTCEYVGGTLQAIVDLPADNDMYLRGEKQKCIYRIDLAKD